MTDVPWVTATVSDDVPVMTEWVNWRHPLGWELESLLEARARELRICLELFGGIDTYGQTAHLPRPITDIPLPPAYNSAGVRNISPGPGPARAKRM